MKRFRFLTTGFFRTTRFFVSLVAVGSLVLTSFFPVLAFADSNIGNGTFLPLHSLFGNINIIDSALSSIQGDIQAAGSIFQNTKLVSSPIVHSLQVGTQSGLMAPVQAPHVQSRHVQPQTQVAAVGQSSSGPTLVNVVASGGVIVKNIWGGIISQTSKFFDPFFSGNLNANATVVQGANDATTNSSNSNPSGSTNPSNTLTEILHSQAAQQNQASVSAQNQQNQNEVQTPGKAGNTNIFVNNAAPNNIASRVENLEERVDSLFAYNLVNRNSNGGNTALNAPVNNVYNTYNSYTMNPVGGATYSYSNYSVPPPETASNNDVNDAVSALSTALNAKIDAINIWTTLAGNIYFNTGNVGIGTTTPSEALSVSGNGNFTGNIAAGGNVNVTGNVVAGAFYGDGSHLTGISSGVAFSTSTTRSVFSVIGPLSYDSTNGIFGISTSTLGLKTSDIAENGNLYFTNARAEAAISSVATGLSYDLSSGIFSLTSGYTIPTIASTTQWASTVASTTLLASNLASLSATTSVLSASTTLFSAFYLNPSTQITAGTGLNWSGNTLSNTGVLSIGGLTGNVSTSSLGIMGGTQWGTSGSNLYYTSGNVGIGTTTNLATLTVQGSGSVNPFLVASSTGARMLTLLQNGNFGIGTSTPIATLSVSGISSLPTTDIFDIASSSGASYLHVTAAGNIGIGTTTPNSTLTIQGLAGMNPFSIASSTGLQMLTMLQNGNIALGASSTNPQNLLTISNIASSTAFKASLLSVDQLELGQLEGGSYFGRVGVKENQFGLENYGGTVWTAEAPPTGLFFGIAMSSDGKFQTAAYNGSNLYISSDYGHTWTTTATSQAWRAVAMSSDGKIQTAVGYSGNIYISSNYGVTWTSEATSQNWKAVAMSSDGRIQTAAVISGDIYISSNYGVTWTSVTSSRSWESIAMSSDGRIQTAVDGSPGFIYLSTDYGHTWVAEGTSQVWVSVAMSADGKTQTAVIGGSGGNLYVSSNYGYTWTSEATSQAWEAVAMSADGKIQVATVSASQPNISTNYGVTWTGYGPNFGQYFTGIAMSSDGKIITAVSNGNGIYVSYADSIFFGDLGINLIGANPAAALNVIATTAGSTTALFAGATNQTGDILELSKTQGAVPGLVFSAVGNLGIGTTTPWAKVSIQQAAGGKLVLFDVATTTSATTFATSSLFRVLANGEVSVGTSTPTSTFFIQGFGGVNPFTVASSTGAQMLTLLQNGNFGVGSNTPQYAFDDQTASSTGYVAHIFNNANVVGANGLIIQAGENVTGGSTFENYEMQNGASVGSVTQNGNTGVLYNTNSDRRLKENIVETHYGLSDLMQVQVSDYDFIADPQHRQSTGLIAQDLYNIFPDAVSKPADENTSYWQVDYGRITPLIIKAVQDLDDQFNSVVTQISGGVAYLTNIVVQSLQIGSSAKPAGITMYDTVTGNPYCLQVQNGITVTEPGACGTQPTPSVNTSNSNSSSSSSASSDSSDSTNSTATTTTDGAGSGSATSTDTATDNSTGTSTDSSSGSSSGTTTSASSTSDTSGANTGGTGASSTGTTSGGSSDSSSSSGGTSSGSSASSGSGAALSGGSGSSDGSGSSAGSSDGTSDTSSGSTSSGAGSDSSSSGSSSGSSSSSDTSAPSSGTSASSGSDSGSGSSGSSSSGSTST